MEMGSNELQTFSMDESGQSGSPHWHEISIRRSKRDFRGLTTALLSWDRTRSPSGALSVGIQLMNRESRVRSKSI